ncbi:phenoloxidase subunit 2-like [Epargyreus clarus]|uniref:phenoloxidase subunit 2-like n=1 Tax=Epargyreus clarus TaxID=520877 RepID=UPI003C2D2B5B
MTDVTKSLELLFDRPGETMLSPKGDDKAVFLLTEEMLPKEYENIGMQINNRFGEEASVTILLQNLKKKPQFVKAKELPADADFSVFLQKHREMADEVLEVLMNVPTGQLQQFLSTCVFSRANLNPQLFNYCYSIALMHRADTREVPIKNFAETFPSKFLQSKVFTQARESAALTAQGAPRIPIIIPRDFTAKDSNIEHRLAYFREDIGVNLHHWHWHLVYPNSANIRSIVAKDRRGELFFYMHQQVVARYNGERLNNSLLLVKKFNNFREPIPEAYFPKLDSLTAARGWPPRQAHMSWSDLDRPVDNVKITIADLERWKRNIEEAIATGLVKLPNDSTQKLDIDTLGNMVESSILSPNQDYYGSLHNFGHNMTAYIHDPQHRYLESFSVMADEGTALRDPFFYRWHAFIDDLFQKFKESPHVRSYVRSELEYPGIRVMSASTMTGGQSNVLNTFWMQSDIDLSGGLDFSEREPVFVRFTHLNHRPYRYVINVNNSTGEKKRATVRIFMAPKFDEGNLEWMLSEQRKMFIEMDRFVETLTPGQNVINRDSSKSTVTIPFEQTFRDLSKPRTPAFGFCGCGWPQHMLVPKGTETGAAYQLFVMLSDYEKDKVVQSDDDSDCIAASSFCGIRDKKYPDKRAMGFPFDRPSVSASKIEDFILPNMALTDITIKLQNVTEKNPRNIAN